MEPNDITTELDQLIQDFSQTVSLMGEIDTSKLPFELQLMLANTTFELTKAMKKYTNEAKKVIVLASALGRT